MPNTNTNLQTQALSVLHNDMISSCSTSKVQEKTQLSKDRCMKSLRAIESQFKFLTDTLQDFESEVQDDSSRSGNNTDADDANIRPIYDEEPMAEVQLTAECNIFAIGQQHAEQPKIINEIFIRHRFSPNKTSVVYEKTSPISDLRWKPTGRIFKSVGLRWIPTGKLFNSCTSKADSEPPHGSNVDIPNIHECKQALDVSACTSINVQKEKSIDLSAVGKSIQSFVNGENLVVSESSVVTTADASDKRQQQPDSTSSTSTTSTLATTATADGNFDVAHSEKLKQKAELRKKMFDQYVWTRDEHFDPNLETEPEPYRHRTETVPTPGFMKAAGKSNMREGIAGKNISDLNMGDQNANAASGVSVDNTNLGATSIKPHLKLTKPLVIVGVSITSKEELIGLVGKIDFGALDDEIYVLTTAERAATHALVMELARGFEYVNSDSDTSCEEPYRVTLDVVSHIDESLIIHSISIQDMPNTSIGATGVSVSEPSKPKANFRSLFLENICNGAECSIPRKVVETVSTRLDNTLYGYFIGKRIAFPVVWKDVLENGPWMICNIPIILKKWSMTTPLSKEELTRIPVWVKIHDVPLQVFSEDGISIISSQLESLTMGVPLIEDEGFSIETITVTPIVEKTNDGFQMVANKKKNGKAKSTNGGKFGGQSVKQSVRYEPKADTKGPKTGVPNRVNSSKPGSSHVSPMPKVQPLKAKVPPLSSRRSPNKKRKAMELEPEAYIAGLHCNKKLHEGVPFKKNLVIEELEHGFFFIDAFGELAF
ncbi:putative reverse transcriptase domain-containing protein [Tanacetum coccineum]